MASDKKDKNVEVYTIPKTEFIPEKKENGREKFWHIDKDMLGFKAHYFLITGTFATSLPYITILARKRVGISASGLAFILTIQRVIFFFAKPSIGYITDYFNKLKVMICILAVTTSVFLFALLAVPKYENNSEREAFDFEQDHFEIFNYSEAYMTCENSINNNTYSINKNNISHFHYLQQMSNFLRYCSFNENKDSQNASESLKHTTLLEQKVSALFFASDSLSCKICCNDVEKCQIYDNANGKETVKEIVGEKSDFQRHQFWLYAVFSTICQGSANSLFTLTDTACCEKVQKTGAQFGRQCLWGAVGWGLMCPIGGLLNDYTGDFLASWVFMAIMIFISLLNITKLKIVNPAFSQNLLKDVGVVLSSKEFLVFMFCVVMNGVGVGIIWFYLVLFLTDIGGSRFLCGMVIFVQNFIAGIPFMFFSGWVIKKIGHFNVLIVSLLAYCIRFFWYSQLHNPWLILPVEVLNGCTEGLLYTSVASFAKLSAKPGTEATTQAMLFTAHESIGIGIGCTVAGLGFDSIGGHRTFLYLSIYAGCAMVISIILKLFIRKQERKINITPTIT